MALKRVRVIVSGLVQGVFFRANTVSMAQGLGLKGWVKNNFDGSVEALFQGEEELVNKAVVWCHSGPTSARVTEVKTQEETPCDALNNFNVKF
jgi:acylphosphatase